MAMFFHNGCLSTMKSSSGVTWKDTRHWKAGVSVPTWWRHQMETFSVLLVICAENSPVTGEFPAQRPVTRSFEVFFDLGLIKRLSKQSRGHHDVTVMYKSSYGERGWEGRRVKRERYRNGSWRERDKRGAGFEKELKEQQEGESARKLMGARRIIGEIIWEALRRISEEKETEEGNGECWRNFVEQLGGGRQSYSGRKAGWEGGGV